MTDWKAVAVPVDRLQHWLEYWNGARNERAMADALEFILGGIAEVIAAPPAPTDAPLTREEIIELIERSKNDRALIVGSEVRALGMMALLRDIRSHQQRCRVPTFDATETKLRMDAADKLNERIDAALKEAGHE